jgi:hypothetical protein
MLLISLYACIRVAGFRSAAIATLPPVRLRTLYQMLSLPVFLFLLALQSTMM